MEYSVCDLVKRLITKWYLILLITCIFAGLALYFSDISYNRAVKEYKLYMTGESLEFVGSGKTSIVIKYDIDKQKVANTLEIIEDVFGVEAPKYSMGSITKKVSKNIEPYLISCLTDGQLLQSVHQKFEEEGYGEKINTSEYFSVHYTGEQTFTISIEGIGKDLASTFANIYLQELSDKMQKLMIEVDFFEEESTFVGDKTEFAQIVMQEPVAKPDIFRTVVTGGVFGFAIACIFVLFGFFVKDARKSEV